MLERPVRMEPLAQLVHKAILGQLDSRVRKVSQDQLVLLVPMVVWVRVGLKGTLAQLDHRVRWDRRVTLDSPERLVPKGPPDPKVIQDQPVRKDCKVTPVKLVRPAM